jgi:hypothetical protein
MIMKISKILTVVLSAFMMMGLGMGVASCSDSDKSDNKPGGEDEPQVVNEQEELGWTLISQLTDEATAPAGWMDKTFEPTIGKAVDGDPYTRVVATNDVETAAARFAELAGNPAGFSEIMTGYSYSLEGVGKLTYKRGSATEPYLAQVDVDLKQVPHLKKILYQTPEQQGNNGSFDGAAYYRFGDVVKDGQGSYWVCVRPSFGPEGKGDSHWISVSTPLSDENTYHYKYKDTDYYLPTGLGKSLEHMQNLCEMLYAMIYPDKWLSNLSSSPRPKFFHDFDFSKNYKYHNIYFWKRVAEAWEANDQALYAKVFKCSKEKLQAAMDDPDKGLNFVYNGYSWKTGWNGGVYHAQFTNGTGKESNMHKMKDDGAVKKYLKDMPVDFRQGPDEKFFDDGRLRFILRYKTGKQLGGGKYHEKTAISNVVGEYVYNEMHKVNLNDNPEVTTQDGDVHPNQDANDPADVKNPQTGIISKPIADVQRHDIGEVVAKNGRIYNSVEEAKKDGTEAVAMIAAMKWESDEVSGKYTGAYPVQMYQIYYKVTHAVAIGFEDIPLTSMPFSTDNTALEASKVDAEWVKAHTVPGATWCQMDSYTLQRMLIECGDKDPMGGQDNLIYCLDDIKKKTEAGLDDYTSYYRTPQATPCELSKKLAECGVNFSGNSKWATNEQDVVFILSRQDQGFDIAFNLRKYETSSHCRFYLKW